MRDELIVELERACRTLRRMKFPHNGAPPSVEQALGARWPDAMQEWTGYGAQPERITRVRPTAEDLDHWDRTWPLILKAQERDRPLIFVRLGYGWGWRKVGRVLGAAHETVRYRFNSAIDKIVKAI